MVIHWELCKILESDHTKWMLKLESLLEYETWNSLGFWDKSRLLNLGQKARHGINYQEQKTCLLVDFTVRTDHWVKIKEGKKIDKYLLKVNQSGPENKKKKIMTMHKALYPRDDTDRL